MNAENTPPWTIIPTKDIEAIHAKLDKANQFIRLAMSNMDYQEKYLTSDQVLKLLQISKKTLENKRKSRQISYIQINGLVRYKLSDIEEYLNNHYVKSK